MRRKRRGELPRMILDRDMCLRVADGDEQVAQPTERYYCPVCCANPSTFSAKLRLAGAPVPTCEDHDPVVNMEAR